MFGWLSGNGRQQRDPKDNSIPKLGSAQSRSTSAGSSSHPSLEEREGGGDGHSGSHKSSVHDMQKLPEYEYPVPSIPEYDYPAPLEVKNTFLDVKAAPGSFLEFFNERRIRSAPGSSLEDEDLKEQQKAVDMNAVASSVAAAASQSAQDEDADSPQTSTEGQGGKQGLPDIEYPVPVINTFLHFKDQALMDCLKKREVRSCPGSKVYDQEGNEIPDAKDQPGSTVSDGLRFPATPFASGYEMPEEDPKRVDGPRVTEHLAAIGSMPPPPAAPPSLAPPVLHQDVQPPPPGVAPGAFAEAAVISLAAALPEPVLGSPEMPTVGSAGHRTGTCKPCAFNHTRGCKGGEQCVFCHLCPPGEKKRRQKEKMAALRAAQTEDTAPSSAMSHMGY